MPPAQPADKPAVSRGGTSSRRPAAAGAARGETPRIAPKAAAAPVLLPAVDHSLPPVSSASERSYTLAAAMPSVAKVVVAVALVKAAVTFYHHYQHLKAERVVAELRRTFATQPMLIMASAGANKDGQPSSIVVEDVCPSCTGATSAPPTQGMGDSSSSHQLSPPPSPPVSALDRSTLSTIRVLSVRMPQPGQWHSVREDDHTSAYTKLERVLRRVHLFAQPRWALAPNLAPEATLLEAYMRLHRIPYTIHTVNVLHGGGGGCGGGAGGAVPLRSRSRAGSWDPERDPTGVYSGLSEEEMMAERVRRVHAHVYSTSRRRSSVGASASTGATALSRLMVLARAVQQAKGRRLPFVVYRGEVMEGDTEAMIGFLNEKFLIPSDEYLLRGDEEATALSQALRRTVHQTLRAEYGVGFICDGPSVFCRYASQAMGPVASPWAMRLWLALPWIGSPLRGDVHRALLASTLGRLSHRQRQAQALKDVLMLENLLRASSGDLACPVSRPFVVADRGTVLDCALYAYLIPIMRLTPDDIAAVDNHAFTYIYDSPVLRDYVTRMTGILFPDLDLMAANVTGLPLAIPYNRERVPARVSRRRAQGSLTRRDGWAPPSRGGSSGVDLTSSLATLASVEREAVGVMEAGAPSPPSAAATAALVGEGRGGRAPPSPPLPAVAAAGPIANSLCSSPELPPRVRRPPAQTDSPLERTPPPLPALLGGDGCVGGEWDVEPSPAERPPAEAPPPAHPRLLSQRTATATAARLSPPSAAGLTTGSTPPSTPAASLARRGDGKGGREDSPAPSRPRLTPAPILKTRPRPSVSSNGSTESTSAAPHARTVGRTTAATTATVRAVTGARAKLSVSVGSGATPRTPLRSTLSGSKLGRASSLGSPSVAGVSPPSPRRAVK